MSLMKKILIRIINLIKSSIFNSDQYAMSNAVANIDFVQSHALVEGKTYTFRVATNISNEVADWKRTHIIRITSGAYVYAEKIITIPNENTWQDPIKLEIDELLREAVAFVEVRLNERKNNDPQSIMDSAFEISQVHDSSYGIINEIINFHLQLHSQ